jgi:transcription elongation GreA/GreB family factor
MIGAKVGDTVKWQRPGGASETEIVTIRYDALPASRRK